MAIRTDPSMCMLCEAGCGLSVEHDGTNVIRIRGDEEDPFSQGYLCPKGVALKDIQNDPDRIRKPLRRRGASWQEISWKEALDEVAARIVQTQEKHGRDSVGMYVGNPSGHSYAGFLFLMPFYEALGTRNRFSATSVDALPRLLVSSWMYGNQAYLPIPDIDRTDHLLVLGANPLVSNGSVMTAPNVGKRLRGIQERGGRVVVIDPRRSETAAMADEHHFIQPGADALLLAGMLHTLFAEGRVDPGSVKPWLDGFDGVQELLAGLSAEQVAPQVGIEAETIKRLARDFASSPRAACYGRVGTCVQEFGALTSWFIDILNIATGNLDREGGVMFTTPAADLGGFAERTHQTGDFARWRSRVSGYPEFNGELPVAGFAEEMETAGEGQIRALITYAGNPVLSLPNGRRLAAAFERLDFMVAIDIYRNETTRYADLILPPTFGLERDGFGLLFNAVAVRNIARYAAPVLEKPESALHDWEILLGLIDRMARLRGGVGRWLAPLQTAFWSRVGPQGILRLLLRIGPQKISLGRLRRESHGVDLGPLEPRLAKLMRKGRRVAVLPEPIRADLRRLEGKLETRPAPISSNGLRLIGRRSLRSNNSWMHNSERLVRGRDRCVLLMHPDDAEGRGLAAGQRVVVKSSVGQIEAPLEISPEVMPGVVSLPHGWGHGRKGAKLSVAATQPGVSLNDVIDDALIDPVSGTSCLNGIPVSVVAVGL